MNMNDPNLLQSPRELGGKYLTFTVCGEQYGVEILRVREIIGLLPITTLPHSPEHVLGVINLRGRVIPVTDLRLRFGMPAAEPTRETCIIVVEVEKQDTTLTMGIVVDEVAEVSDIEGGSTADPPRFNTTVNAEFLLGTGMLDRTVVMLLDIARVVSRETSTDQDPLSPQQAS